MIPAILWMLLGALLFSICDRLFGVANAMRALRDAVLSLVRQYRGK